MNHATHTASALQKPQATTGEALPGSPGAEDRERRELTLLVTGRCRRCAERLPGGAALGGGECPNCKTPTSRTAADRDLVLAAFEARAHARTWIAVLVAVGTVLVAGWSPAVGGAVILGALAWVQLAIVRPANRLLSVRRRVVAGWTFRLVAAVASAFAVFAVELLTLVPVLGVIGKAVGAAAHVAVLALAARRYMGWQTRREGRGVPVAVFEYLLLASTALLLVVAVTASFAAASWIVGRASALAGTADALASKAALAPESLRWASTIGLGAATGTRAALFLVVSGVLSHVAPTVVPQQLHFLGTAVGLGIAVAFVVIESATERDDDLQTVFGLAAGGARVAAAGLLGVVGSGQPPSSSAAMLAGAVGAVAAFAAATSRGWLHATLRQLETEAFSPRRWLNRLEEGGVAGLAVAVYAGPMLAVGFVAVGLGATLVAAVVAKGIEARSRRPCPACGRALRVEASGCPRCAADVPVARSVLVEAIGITSAPWRS